jgi:4-hydroxy-2-oxoheptanedioate aldolase
MMRFNSAKERLLAGKPAVGAAAGLGPLGAELLAMAGFHYILVDDQHSLWQPEQVMAAFRAIRLAGSVPMARVQKNDFGQIGAMLDKGALGIVVPMVNTVEQARAAADAMRFPPRGTRSAGAYGCMLYGQDYSSWIDDDLFLAVQIESKEAAQHAEEIMAVDGVDGCWIGPADLANSMGLDVSTPAGMKAREEAIMHVLEACRKTHKAPGIACVGAGQQRLEQGFLFVTTNMDFSYVYAGAAASVQEMKARGYM